MGLPLSFPLSAIFVLQTDVVQSQEQDIILLFVAQHRLKTL